jgi:hypothetical protein
MKEAGTNSDQGQPTPTPDQEPGNGKAEKDMKGLVYAEPVQPGDSPYKEEEAPTEEPKPDKGGTQSPEGDSILTFTEKDSRGKIVMIAIIAVIIIAIVAYLVINPKVLSLSPIKQSSTTTVASSNSPSTTTIKPNPNQSNLVNLDLLYQYSGPVSINGTNCGGKSVSTVKSFSTTFNASSTFLYSLTQSSGSCPLTITKIAATTPGFKVVSITPSMPISIPSGSSVYLVMTIATSPNNYTGPLSLTVSEN